MFHLSWLHHQNDFLVQLLQMSCEVSVHLSSCARGSPRRLLQKVQVSLLLPLCSTSSSGWINTWLLKKIKTQLCCLQCVHHREHLIQFSPVCSLALYEIHTNPATITLLLHLKKNNEAGALSGCLGEGSACKNITSPVSLKCQLLGIYYVSVKLIMV